MTTPPPGQALTAETVKLLVKGDLLRRRDGTVVTLMADGLPDASGDETFIGRPDESGWIAWSGGDNPVPGHKIDLIMRAEPNLVEVALSDDMRWTHDYDTDGGDIIAFRLASQSTAPTRGEGETRHVRHLKRGTIYEVLGEARLQQASQFGPVEGDAITFYRGEDGQLWARATSEFEDGRFEDTAPTPPEPVASALADGEGLASCYDKRGIPIERGDIVKVFHFIGARGKRHYMFKQCLGLNRYPSSPEGWQKVFFSHLNFCEIGDRNGPYHQEPGQVLRDYEIVQSIKSDHESRPRAAEAIREPKSGGGE